MSTVFKNHQIVQYQNMSSSIEYLQITKDGQCFTIKHANVQFIEQYDAKIQQIVENNPRNWAKVLKSKAFDGRYEDRTYLIDYIRNVTPLLSDEVHTFKTRVYWVLNHLVEFPWCHNTKHGMHQMTTFNVKKLKDGYSQYCNSTCQHEAPSYYEGISNALERKYGTGVRNSFQIQSVKQCLIDKKDEIESKKYQTRRKNHTFKSSQPEDDVYELIKTKYCDVIRQYKSPKYPWMCDFYIPQIDTYVEYNGCWTHNGHPFDATSNEDQATLEIWRAKAQESQFFKNAINTWTQSDVAKRNFAKENDLNFIELWTINDVKQWLSIKDENNSSLLIEWNKAKAKYEFNYYMKYQPKQSLQYLTNKNFIVKYFQQDVFYGKQKIMWKDPQIRSKLVENRCKYLGKLESDLTSLELLDGFKHSGIYYGYSHFNPNWFKWFIQRYGCKKCYDPTGGWGHRLLGSGDLDLYIYNDLSKHTKENVDRIVKYFKIENVQTYCNDAQSFVPDEDFDSMFTCPPYFNVEEYECGRFDDINQYNSFIDSLFNVFHLKKSCKVFGLVLREDLIGNHLDFVEKIEIPVKRSHFNQKSRSEFMYIYMK